MELRRIPLGAFQTNCYLVINEETKECLLFDPGASGEAVADYLDKEGLTLKAILLTHGHADHIGGVQDILNRFDVPLYMEQGDLPMLEDPVVNLSAKMGQSVQVDKEPIIIKEGDTVTEAGLEFTVIETPGHTPGGVCFYKEGILIAGDTLFNGSIGRTDFPGGSFEELIKNIKEKLYTLPSDTVVYPGHGPETTIEDEKDFNPFTS